MIQKARKNLYVLPILTVFFLFFASVLSLFPAISANSVESFSDFSDEEIRVIEERINSDQNTPIQDNESWLYGQQEKLTDLLDKLKIFRYSNNPFSTPQKIVQDFSNNFDQKIDSAKNICKTQTAPGPMGTVISELEIYEIKQFLSTQTLALLADLARFPSCETLQAAEQQGLHDYLEKDKKDLRDSLVIFDEKKKKIGRVIENIELRLLQINDKIAKSKEISQRKNTLTDNLWVILLVIGGLSVGSMIMVTAFNDDIQMEWVASGQVIQFVTVMILISVILALGLTDVIKENVLGTLLGGIGGYVLSQGVGRAAAQAVRRVKSNEVPPAPSPPSPPAPAEEKD